MLWRALLLTLLFPLALWSAQRGPAEQRAITQAIARHEVIVGMTPKEVTLACGKPDWVDKGRDAKGAFEYWAYTRRVTGGTLHVTVKAVWFRAGVVYRVSVKYPPGAP